MTKHRDLEIQIAEDITDRLFAGVQLTSKPPSLAACAHALGAACKARDFVPDEAAYHRILFDIVNDIGERRRAADGLNAALVRSTAELIERRRR
jgi:hypothetical protein